MTHIVSATDAPRYFLHSGWRTWFFLSKSIPTFFCPVLVRLVTQAAIAYNTHTPANGCRAKTFKAIAIDSVLSIFDAADCQYECHWCGRRRRETINEESYKKNNNNDDDNKWKSVNQHWYRYIYKYNGWWRHSKSYELNCTQTTTDNKQTKARARACRFIKYGLYLGCVWNNSHSQLIHSSISYFFFLKSLNVVSAIHVAK